MDAPLSSNCGGQDLEQRDLRHLLSVEAEIGKASSSSRKVVDVSTYGVIALAEMLTLREHWKAAGHTVALRGAPARPLLQVVRSIVAGQPNVEWDVVGRRCGCLKVPAAQGGTYQDAQQRFLLAASGAMNDAGYPVLARQRVLGAFGELIDNVFEHAGVCNWALAAYELDGAGRFSAAVMDCGEGVVAGYRRHGTLGDHVGAAEALDMAVLQHRSSTGRSDRGLGFKTLLDALRTLDAYVRVRSDDASLTLAGGSPESRPRLSEEFELLGFVVGFRARHRA